MLLINADGAETRVALLENEQLAEFYVERKQRRSIVGNIYRGKVARVLPGMQAAFIDFGQRKAGYLQVSEVRGAPEDFQAALGDTEWSTSHVASRPNTSKIEDLLKPGQEIMVQVSKAPIGQKGARLTAYVSLPGRLLVLMPTVDNVGISRRIENIKERERLRAVVQFYRPELMGFIVRTAALGISEAELCREMASLGEIWKEIVARNGRMQAPALLYQEPDVVLRAVRDLASQEMPIVTDTPREFQRIQKFMSEFMPRSAAKLELYEGDIPLFDKYNLETQIDRALAREVPLRSGGSVIFDQGEALTAVDVNSGKFVGKRNLEETITKLNIEACREIGKQIRLRNLGGVIVIDFIDMDQPVHREQVMKALAAAFEQDRARAQVLALSEFGLVEMTRKRTEDSIGHLLTEPCDYCGGKGYNKSKLTICYEILRQLRRAARVAKGRSLEITCHPDVAELLQGSEKRALQEVAAKIDKSVTIQLGTDHHIEQFSVTEKK